MRIRVRIKLVRTSMPRVRANTMSTLCSKFATGLEAPNKKYGDKLVIPVPNIIYIQAGG